MTTPGDILYGPHRCTCSPTVLVCPACYEFACTRRGGIGFRGKHIKDSADLAARRVLYEAEYAKARLAGKTRLANQYRQVLTRLAKWEER